MRADPTSSTPALERADLHGTSSRRPTVVHVTTVPISLLTHLSGQVGFVQRSGFAIHVISSPGPELDAFAERERIPVHAIPMLRAITPLRDLVALWRLWRTLRRIRPEIVHSHTPKGGLLGMIAATLARTPVRVYHLRGSPFVTATGIRRQLLRMGELASCSLAHRVFAVSRSLRDVAIDEGLCSAEKVAVLAGGSGNGVDPEQFHPSSEHERLAARAACGIPADDLVVGFVGRLTRDKGICELERAWRGVREAEPRARLLLVGGNEAHDAQSREAIAAFRADPRVHLTGLVAGAARLYAAVDVVVLPTYREGFPNVALEAAAVALPIVATSVPGCVEAVEDGVTGLLVPVRDAESLERALRRYLSDPALRADHGQAGRRRAVALFRGEVIWEALVAEYRRLMLASPPATPTTSASEGS